MRLQEQENIASHHRWSRNRRSDCRDRYEKNIEDNREPYLEIQSLKRAGHDVIILEQVSEIYEVGAGTDGS